MKAHGYAARWGMTKGELIDLVAAKDGFNLRKAEIVVNTIFDAMTEALSRGERVEIRGFGSFEVREYDAYRGRNPKTGAEVSVKAKRAPFFKTGKELRERVDGPDAPATPEPAGRAERRTTASRKAD
jgi:integration host factor subunit beta